MDTASVRTSTEPTFCDGAGTTRLLVGIHFLQAVFTGLNYVVWVRSAGDVKDGSKTAYMFVAIMVLVTFFTISSAFYALAYRWPNPNRRAAKRVSWGVLLHLIFASLPAFILEADIVTEAGMAAPTQVIALLLAVLSLVGSALRSWLFLTTRYIRHDMEGKPQIGALRRGASASPSGSPFSGGGYEAMESEDPGRWWPYTFVAERPGLALVCMVLYLASVISTAANYGGYISTSEAKRLNGDATAALYVVALILGGIAFFTVGTIMWFWAWMTEHGSERVRRLVKGVCFMFFLHTCPTLAIDIYCLESHGHQDASQVGAMLFGTLCFIIGVLALWLPYLYRVAGDMQRGNCILLHLPDNIARTAASCLTR
eukprot:Hpha_TRINITY_DN15479_c1_g1::TRINITY_DN15479_c1_g1_i1::g.173232::m.173232